MHLHGQRHPRRKLLGVEARMALLLLSLVNVLNQWSRYLISYLYAVSSSEKHSSLEASTGLTEAQYSLLAGVAFSVVLVLCGLFTGRLADRGNRVRLVVWGGTIWNIATFLQGRVSNFAGLLVCRVLLGFGQAFLAPAAISLIADLFPRHARAQANSVYSFGIYVGSGMSSLSIAMAVAMGWRETCYTVAGIGFFVIFLFAAAVREPARPNPDGTSAQGSAGFVVHDDSLASSAGGGHYHQIGQHDDDDNNQKHQHQHQHQGQHYHHQHNGAEEKEDDEEEGDVTHLLGPTTLSGEFMHTMTAVRDIVAEPLLAKLLLASAFRFGAGYIVLFFLPYFYKTTFPAHNLAYSYCNAFILSVGGILSSYTGGYLADALERNGYKYARLDVPAWGCFLAIPWLALLLLTSSFCVSMIGLAGMIIFGETWLGPVISVQQNTLPARYRGIGYALFSLVTVVSGSAFAWLFGVVDSSMTDETIGVELLLVVGICLFLAGIMLYSCREDMHRVEYGKNQFGTAAMDVDDERKPLTGAASTATSRGGGGAAGHTAARMSYASAAGDADGPDDDEGAHAGGSVAMSATTSPAYDSSGREQTNPAKSPQHNHAGGLDGCGGDDDDDDENYVDFLTPPQAPPPNAAQQQEPYQHQLLQEPESPPPAVLEV